MAPYPIGFISGALTVALVLALWYAVRRGLDGLVPVDVSEEPPPAVDPWALQRRLMEISDQARPALPEVNETTLLYWALMLEEMGETGCALLAVLERAWSAHRGFRLGEPPPPDLRAVAKNSIDVIQNSMRSHSRRLRKVLEDMGRFRVEVTRAEAKELLDGTTDNAVVNAGFSVSAGLPGAAAYLRVLTSNLSKANPATGVIDKTPDGKWIKGSEYRMPDLDAAFDEQEELLGMLPLPVAPLHMARVAGGGVSAAEPLAL